MAPKDKTQKTVEEGNPSTALLDLDHLPLVDFLFKVTDCECDFDFHELHLWLKQKYAVKKIPFILGNTFSLVFLSQDSSLP